MAEKKNSQKVRGTKTGVLTLLRVLGHTDIKMTMRYAHFASDHLEDAVRLNPLQKAVHEPT